MIKDLVHSKILAKEDELDRWFAKNLNPLVPFYTSFDMRDSNEKISPVDANLFPGGFHLTCSTDRREANKLIEKNLKNKKIKRIGLVCETPSLLSFYWENIATLKNFLNELKYEVFIIPVKEISHDISFETSTKKKINLSCYEIKKSLVYVQNQALDYLISNSDFSNQDERWERVALDPLYEMGWHNRNKINFFIHYNHLMREFCKIIDLNPFYLSVQTETFSSFDISSKENLEKLSKKINLFLEDLKKQYESLKIPYKPYLFIKNASGTYGMGILKINSPEDVLHLNSKARSQMKKMKGGSKIKNILLQEGIPSEIKSDGFVSEPVIYMIGDELMGGFLRSHSKKDSLDNLNSPGAVYKTLCLSDLKINPDKPTENVYGWLAKVSFLAIGQEIKQII